MSKRTRLEAEVEHIKNVIKTAPDNTPLALRKQWEQELVDMEFELNNLVDGDEDNNLDDSV